MKVDEVIGLRVAEARRAAGMTQAQLGERIAEWLPGRWYRQIVQNGEAGRRPWSVVELFVLAKVLGLFVTDLLALPVTAEPRYTLPQGEVAAIDVLGREASSDEQSMLLDALRNDMRNALRDSEHMFEVLRMSLGTFRSIADDLDRIQRIGPGGDDR